MPEKRTHDYVRHGTRTLFAAFNTADGTVISSVHRRHRTIEFKKFLTKIDNEVPAHLQVHLVCDNYGTHKTPTIKRWFQAHPRFTRTRTRAGSTRSNAGSPISPPTCDHRSVQALENDIRNWIAAWNDNPKPFVWTKTAEQILESLG